MKRIVMAGVGVSAVLGLGLGFYPEDCQQTVEKAAFALVRLVESIEANPAPVLFALGTFLATVIYHTARGKTLRESVEVAATRVTVVPVPQPEPSRDENPVIKRAKARATRAQLLVDQIGLQNRHRKLPDEIVKTEKEAAYSEQALQDAERNIANKQKAHDEVIARLEALRQEDSACKRELAEIDKELKKLSELI